MKCTVVSYSLSEDPAALKDWQKNLLTGIKAFVDQGSDLILYPELFLMNVAKYLPKSGPLAEIRQVAHYLQAELLPEIAKILHGQDVLLVLGSGPREVAGEVFNSAPVFVDDRWVYQDKLFLTPWETDFTAGKELKIFNFRGLKTSVVICFDSEQPDLALKLKEEGIDLLLVPSATTNENGSHRVNRCSSARAVELGAAVLTSPLVGDTIVDLIDHNEGRQGFFLPAQEDVKVPQEVFSEYSRSGKVVGHYQLDLEMMRALKTSNSETKPYNKSLHPHLKLTKL